jgi:hypothetical protein
MMNKAVLAFAAGALIASSITETSQQSAPKPPKCEASSEAKAMMSAQGKTINDLTAMVGVGVDGLKKSVQTLANSCSK